MTHIFWPDDLPLRPSTLYGRRITSDLICVTSISVGGTSSDARHDDSTPTSDHVQPRKDANLYETQIGHLIPLPPSQPTMTWSYIPFPHSPPQTPQIITYTPPNSRRYRHLSLVPIRLTPGLPITALEARQLRALEVDEGRPGLGRKRQGDGLDGLEGLEGVLGVINRCFELRRAGLEGQQLRTRSKPRSKANPIPNPDPTPEPAPPSRSAELHPPQIRTTRLIQDEADPTLISRIWDHLIGVSASANQLNLRLTQLINAFSRWKSIQPGSGLGSPSPSPSTGSVSGVSVRYIRFCNTIWLIVNDLIFGWTIGRLIEHHKSGLLEPIQLIQKRWLVETIKSSLTWMDDWPVGLKLNTPLSGLLCTLFSGMADIWDSIWTSDPTLSNKMILALSLGSYLGASMFLSVAKDIIGLSTLHLTIISWIMRQVYRAEVSAMYTLWNLFRGKRWNTLRHRVDSFDYEIDQLFLGTLLFTVTIFLLPTIFTYYTFFSFVQIGLLLCNFTIETALAFINSFPLFALMLRIKEPSRLPGGVKIEVHQMRKGMDLGPHLVLKNVPLSLGAIFSGFGASWAELSAQYSPARLLVCILTGVL